MKKNFTHLLAGVAIATLSACGGGGGGGGAGSSNLTANSSTLSGSVMDGYLTGATVCLDTNANLLCDSGEPTATSQAKGAWSFSVPAGTDTSKLHIIAVINANTIDADTGIAPQQGYTLLAPATAASVVTPLTTLVSHTLLESPGLTLAQAQAKAISDSNLPAGTKFDEDYVAKSNTSAHYVAKLIADVLGQSAAEVNTSFTPSNDSEKSAALKVALAQAKPQIAAYAAQAAQAAIAADVNRLQTLRDSAKTATQEAITSDTSISVSVKSTAKVGTPKPVSLSSVMNSDGMFTVWPDYDCSVNPCKAGAAYKRTYTTDSTHIATEGYLARIGSNTWGSIPKEKTIRYRPNKLANRWVDESSIPTGGTIELSSNGMSGLFTDNATKSTANISITELDISGKNSKDVAKLNYNYCTGASVTSIGCIELLDFAFPAGSKLFVTTFYDNEDDYIYWDCGDMCGVFAAGKNTPVSTLDAAIASVKPLFHFGGAYIELDANGQKVSLFDESEQPPTPLASGTYQIQKIAGLNVFSLNVTTVHDPAKWFNKGRDKYTLSTIWVESNGKVWQGKKDNKGTITQTTYFNRTAVDTVMKNLGLPATKP